MAEEILFQIPTNPLPAGAEAGFFHARDGTRLRYGLFRAPRQPARGTVIILPGRLSFIEKYFEVIQDFQSRGINIAMMDLRGSGGSQRLLKNPHRHFVRDFGDFVDDIRQFVDEQVVPSLEGPCHLLGHSSGGLIALLAEPALRDRINSIIVVAPMLEGPGISMATARRITKVLMGVGLGTAYVGGGDRKRKSFSDNKATTDRRRAERTEDILDAFPVLAIGEPTVTFVNKTCEAIAKVTSPQFQADIRTPMLFIVPDGDVTVSVPAMLKYAEKVPAARSIIIEGARHDIMQEADVYRNQVFAAIDSFLGDIPSPRA